MEVFRLCKELYAQQLDGKGAAIYGGRWNSRGVEIIYTASNRSLAMAELLVHVSLAFVPDDFYMMTIHLPDKIFTSELPVSVLPVNWNSFPYSTITKGTGDNFVLDGKFAVLKVPSAVTKGDCNYLLNPRHPEFTDIRIIDVEKFPFDKRIYRLFN